MSNEVTKKESHELVPIGFTPFNLTDLQVPFLLCAQSNSEAVFNKIVDSGDIYETVNFKVVGNTKKPVEIIPIGFFKMWALYQGTDFIGHEEYKDGDNELPDEIKIDKDTVKKRTFNYYCLLADDVKNGVAFPYIATFKGSSLRRAGRGMASLIQRGLDSGVKPFELTIKLQSVLKKYQSNNYFTMIATQGRKTSKDELVEVERWRKKFSEGV